MEATFTNRDTTRPWDTQTFGVNVNNHENWGLTNANYERVCSLLARYPELDPVTYQRGLRLPALQFLLDILDVKGLTLDKLNNAVNQHFYSQTNTGSSAPRGYSFNGRWILVAGTGDFEVPLDQQRFCQVLGRLLAERGFGLICGGWQGVDAQVAMAYSEFLSQNSQPVIERLVQLLEANQQPAVALGRLEYSSGSDWNQVAAERAECLVMIGGKGGTFDVFERFRRYGKKTIPIASTGGDAQRAFGQLTSQRYDLSNSLFWEALSIPVNNNKQAEDICEQLMLLIDLPPEPVLA